MSLAKVIGANQRGDGYMEGNGYLVSTDYLLMGSEPSKEEVKNDLLSIISELSTIATKSDDTEYGKVSYVRFHMPVSYTHLVQ